MQTAYDQGSQTSNFIDAFGPLKVSGYGLTGQSSSLRLSVGSGISFIHGGFYQNDPEFPSQITTPSQATASLAYVYRSGSGVQFDTNGGNLYTSLRPGFYDNGTGITSSLSNNNWTIQRIYSDPKTGVLYVYYGQTIYTTYLNAVGAVATDAFTEGDTFDFTTFIGFAIVKSNTSNITDTDNKLVPAGLFRGSGQGSGGGIAVSNLDDLTDVSILSPTNGQALIYDAGLWKNGIPTNASTASFISGSTNAFIQGGNSFGATALLGTNDNQSLALETSGSTRMFISSSGNVGVGLDNPTHKLHVSSSATGQALKLSGTGANYIDFLVDNRSAIGWNGSSGTIYLSGRGNGLFIGNTPTDASARLHVKGSGTTSATTTLLVQNSTPSTLFSILDNGNVGVGTAAPSFLLDVSGSARSQVYHTNFGTSSINLLTSGQTAQTADRGIFVGLGTFSNSSVVGVALGVGVNLGTGTGNVAIGYTAQASSGGIAISSNGQPANAAGGIAIGANSTSNGGIALAASSQVGSVSIMSTSQQAQSVTIGPNCTSNGLYSVTIGDRLNNSFQSSVAIGLFSRTTANNQLVIGSNDGFSNGLINDVYFGSGVQRNGSSNAAGSNYTINGSGALGTNFAGGNITIAGGKGTGTGASGDVIFSTATPTTSGSTLQTLTQRFKVFGDTGNVSIQSGGTFTDAGFKLDVSGSVRITNNAVITGSLIVRETGGDEMLNTSTSTLYRLGTASVDWRNRTLNNSAASVILDWENNLIYDTLGNPSIDWENRVLWDLTGGAESIDYGRRKLYNSAGDVTLDYNAGELTGTASFAVSSSRAVSSSYAVTASYVLGGGAAFPYVGDAVITGSLAISQSLLQYSSTTAITVGAPVDIASFPTSSYRAGFFDYVAFSSTNARAGTVMAVWSGTSVEFSETSTNDIGSTSALTLSASLSGANIRLQGVSTSGTWTVETLARLI